MSSVPVIKYWTSAVLFMTVLIPAVLGRGCCELEPFDVNLPLIDRLRCRQSEANAAGRFVKFECEDRGTVIYLTDKNKFKFDIHNPTSITHSLSIYAECYPDQGAYFTTTGGVRCEGIEGHSDFQTEDKLPGFENPQGCQVFQGDDLNVVSYTPTGDERHGCWRHPLTWVGHN